MNRSRYFSALCVIIFLCLLSVIGCSQYHEKQGYIPLSAVPEDSDKAPLLLRVDEMEVMQLSQRNITVDEIEE